MGKLFLNSTFSLRESALVGVSSAVVAAGVLYGILSSSAALAHDDHGPRVTETRDVPAFTRILVRGALELDLKAGVEQSVVITARQDHMQKMKTYVKDGILYLDMREGDDDNIVLNDDESFDVQINVPSLEGIEIEGAIDADLRNIKAEKFVIDVRGAADIDIDGTCEHLTLDMRGAGDIDADDFECKSVAVDVRGAGAASVYASETIDADVSGVASLSVYGQPKTVKRDSSGFASISIR